VLRPLVARFGPEAVERASLQVLGYPAWMIHTSKEACSVQAALSSPSESETKGTVR